MKLASKVIGSVNPSTVCRSDGHLLFACGADCVITGGENNQQLVFKTTTERVGAISAANNEPLVAIASKSRIEVLRILRSPVSCVNMSRLLSHAAKTPLDAPTTSMVELTIETTDPVKLMSLSPEGSHLATVDERNCCRIYRLEFETYRQIHTSRLANVLSISLGRLGHLIINYPRHFRLLSLRNEKMKEYRVRHPDTVTYYAWRMATSGDNEQLALLTICRRVLRVWRRRRVIGAVDERFTFQLAGAKLIPSAMEFTWLQNRHYNPSDDRADYLISVFDGALHFWSVTGLESANNVIISTLRTIPQVYPFHSPCTIQVRPCYVRAMPRAQSMLSLSPSIATSINLGPESTQGLNGPRLYLDVVHTTGELNTISLSGTGGLSETSSVRAHFQAGGHNAPIVSIERHPLMPVFLTIDRDQQMLLWRMNAGCLEQLGKYRLKKDLTFKWLPIASDESLYCVAYVHSQAQLILLNLSKSNQLIKSDFMSAETGSFGFAVGLQRQLGIRLVFI